MADNPIPTFDPDMTETVAANVRRALRLLADDNGRVDRSTAEEAVARRVPGAGPPIARKQLDRMDDLQAIEDAAGYMG